MVLPATGGDCDAIGISDDGNTIGIANTNSAITYFYKWIDNAWVVSGSISLSQPRHLRLNSDGTAVAIKSGSTTTNIRIYDFNGTSWVLRCTSPSLGGYNTSEFYINSTLTKLMTETNDSPLCFKIL